MRMTNDRGFTMIEVLITLLVVSVGMLGLAKLEAAATAESQVSRTRALMTMQAESLASMLRANPAYWATGTPNVVVASSPGAANATFSGSPFTLAQPTNSNKNCTAATSVTSAAPLSTPVCTTAAMVAFDDIENTFGPTFNKQFPTGQAAVSCSTPNGGPTNCKIAMSWTERAAVAINRTANATSTTVAGIATLVLYVQL